MKQLEQKCGTCKHWCAELDKAGRRKRTPLSMHCDASLAKEHYDHIEAITKRLACLDPVFFRRMMAANKGTDCQSWEAWK